MKAFRSAQMLKLKGSGDVQGLFWSYMDAQIDGEELSDELCQSFAEFPIVDPSGSNWGSMGFIRPIATDEALCLYNKSAKLLLMCVESRQRILPGENLRAAVEKRITRLEARQGHKLHKKERAQVRDEVEAEMLPKCLIRSTRCYIVIKDERVIVFTGSAKVSEDVTAMIRKAVGSFPVEYVTNEYDMSFLLTETLKQGVYTSNHGSMYPRDAATLQTMIKGEGRGRITLKEENLETDTIKEHLANQYLCTKLLLRVFREPTPGSDTYFTCSMNDKGAITGIKFSDVVAMRAQEEVGEIDDENDRRQLEFDATLLIMSSAWFSLFDMLEDWHEKQTSEQDKARRVRDSDEQAIEEISAGLAGLQESWTFHKSTDKKEEEDIDF